MDHYKKNNKGKKSYPRVPIKTYKWEDIRRLRRKGGYPWTYLYKEPFNELTDLEQFKMSILRKSKSSSTFEKREGVDICDVTEKEEDGAKIDSLQIVTEPDDNSARNSVGSIVIEEFDLSDADVQQLENATLESADSSDNISQYLDKDDRGPNKELESKNKINSREGDLQEKSENGEGQNIANEEQLKRKRKLSAESRYSRLSSTKEVVLQKIKDTKNKIKVPKLTLTVNKLKRSHPKPIKSTSTSLETKKEIKNKIPAKDKKPVYIHIPLKPPPGETDEFSYLEFEENPVISTPPTKGVGSFKFLAKHIKQLQETYPNEQPSNEQLPIKIPEEKNDSILKEELQVSKGSETKNDTIKNIVEKTDKSNIQEKSIEVAGQMKDIKMNETVTNEIIEDSNAQPPKGEELPVSKCTETTNDTTEKIAEETEESNIQEKSTEVEGQTKYFKMDETVTKEEIKDDQPPKGILKEKQERARSAEPDRRRKLSLESSYSRKSLSKLEFMKKLKETSQKIRKTFSINRKQKQPDTEKTIQDKDNATEEKTKLRKNEQQVKPVYIYIPLKSPEEEKIPEDDSKQLASLSESPVENDVQFIILTAPSDDEVLDYHSSDVPETPSDNKIFFENKIEELKKIAKDAVSDITPVTDTDKLEPVTEETLNVEKVNNEVLVPPIMESVEKNVSNGDKEVNEMQTKLEERNLKLPDKISNRENVKIDVEDGLSESFIKEDKQEPSDQQIPKNINIEKETEELNLNLEKVSPIKKKVSFKRRSRTSKDYEDIAPHNSTNISGGTEEQKEIEPNIPSDLNIVTNDEIQLPFNETATVSQKEDSDNWSKISDHEYEPVNPPSDVHVVFSSTPTINVVPESSIMQLDNTYPEILNRGIYVPVNDEVSHTSDPLSPNEKEVVTNISVHIQPTDAAQNQELLISDKNKDPNKFQMVWKQTTDQFKNKLRRAKKNETSEQNNPKSQKFKFKKPKFTMPKIPDKPKLNLPSLPSFNLPRRNSVKRSHNERQESTESNVGDSKKITFDFSTYPKVLKKLKLKTERKNEEFLDLATVPNPERQETNIKNSSGSEIIRVPLHSKQSISDENIEILSEDKQNEQKNKDTVQYPYDDNITSHIRYKNDIDIDDEFESQEINNDDYLNRWNRGNFNPDLDANYSKQLENLQYEVTDLDFPENFDFNSNHNKESYSSGSSFGDQRVAGVLEEINPDEFFLRQKGISQDNIEVGLYLSSEIKEAFRTPENALSKMEDRDYNINTSNQSLQETLNKRKPIKKPKRKKTPYISQEKLPHHESDDDIDFTPPSRPKRRSKKSSKPKNFENIIPFQETIPLETNASITSSQENIILNKYDQDIDTHDIHENKEQEHSENNWTNPDNLHFEYLERIQIEEPTAPPRKQKSLKSLNSENDSIFAEISSQIQSSGNDLQNEESRTDSVFDTSTNYPLKRPSRKKSRTSLQSQTSLQSKDFPQKEEHLSSSQLFTYDNQTPCVEEPCVEDIRDSMGYAIIDKQKIRDPPLPPPRTLGHKKKINHPIESNFFTVPRQSRYEDAPVRPLRNYSTLDQTKKALDSVTYENKENIDIMQYIEIEDEPNRDLQSGDIIRKMKDRPLPAPPRPPRKSRVLQNITSKENIMSDIQTPKEITNQSLIHDDKIDEEQRLKNENVIESLSIDENSDECVVERRLITPEYFIHEETITHGSLLVQSLDGDKILGDSEISRSEERVIPVSMKFDDETSSVLEDCGNLNNFSDEANSKQNFEEINRQETFPVNTEIEVLKAQKLQVVDLDVDTLTVNKLLAGKIIVSEIDSHSIQADEINSKFYVTNSAKTSLSKTAQLSESNTIDQTERTEENNIQTAESGDDQKTTATGINENKLDEAIICSEEVFYEEDAVKQKNQTHPYNQDTNEPLQIDPPEPPPRSLDINIERHLEDSGEHYYNMLQSQEIAHTISNEVMQELDVDDEPPPRPPQPHIHYIPSQPPPSFYALKAEKYVDSVDGNIPKIPWQKRPPRSISGSSSENSLIAPVSRRLHNRTTEPSVSQLSQQLIRTCGARAHDALKRLIINITDNIKKNTDGKLDLHVMTIIMLILIAGLILLGYGEEKTIVHLHHWEYFNPPKDL